MSAQHPDEQAVDRFAAAMKAKLAQARAKGRGGWDDPAVCSAEHLSRLLVEHLGKGNPGTFEDVANFAMMLHQRNADPAVLARARLAAEAELQQAEEQVRDLKGLDRGLDALYDDYAQLKDREAAMALRAETFERGYDNAVARNAQLRQVLKEAVAWFGRGASHGDEGERVRHRMCVALTTPPVTDRDAELLAERAARRNDMRMIVSAWGPRDVMRKLADAADILLDEKGYDGDGWEQIATARDAARHHVVSNTAAADQRDDPSSLSYLRDTIAGLRRHRDDLLAEASRHEEELERLRRENEELRGRLSAQGIDLRDEAKHGEAQYRIGQDYLRKWETAEQQAQALRELVKLAPISTTMPRWWMAKSESVLAAEAEQQDAEPCERCEGEGWTKWHPAYPTGRCATCNGTGQAQQGGESGNG